MRSNIRPMVRRALFTAAVVCVAVAGLVVLPKLGSTAVGPQKSTVKLYSGGEQVGEWEAIGAGREEGQSFVFRVNRGVREVEVRIRGTWSVEALP